MIALALGVGLLVVQVAAGIATGSLALISDAGHVATDAVGVGMAVLAIVVASRHSERTREGRARPGRTYGWYRLEVLAALANALLLLGVAVYVVIEALRRLAEPQDVAGGPVLVIGVLGLVVNLVSFALLRSGASESMNVEGAYLEVLADLIGSVGVVVGGIILAVTGWSGVDAIVGVAIGLWVVPRSVRLGLKALRVLVQAAPPGIDLGSMREDLAGVPGVVDVHDLHVWTLTSDMEVATAHLMVRVGTDAHAVLDQARHVLASRHGVAHATLQVEPDDHTGCDELDW
jgi:cobalt-zinc-cadmium efflux system protein